jgi:ESS family glutamate:Na+ symporter
MQFDSYLTLVAASGVLLLGRLLVSRIRVLQSWSIPEPVAGGLAVALLLTLLRQTSGFTLQLDTSLQAPLMLAFFATIGLNADLRSLARGGRMLGRFLLVVVGLLILQNLVGVSVARLLGLDGLVGLLAGSITLSGGHGTGAAWSSSFASEHGLLQASELAMAVATFGLVLGGLCGGPVARWLMRRPEVLASAAPPDDETLAYEQPEAVRLITAPRMIDTLALIAASLSLGSLLAGALAGTPLALPAFVCVLFVGALLRNLLAIPGWYEPEARAVSVLGNVSLALFLAMALMSLRLWELSALALPLLAIIAAQLLLMLAYAVFVTFRFMGGNYDAAVLAAGHCGFGMGATPTAIANMQAVTQRYGPSHLAFLLVPMVGAFFIDIVNAAVIKVFVMLLG